MLTDSGSGELFTLHPVGIGGRFRVVIGPARASHVTSSAASERALFSSFSLRLFRAFGNQTYFRSPFRVTMLAEVYRKTAKPPGQTTSTGFDNSDRESSPD